MNNEFYKKLTELKYDSELCGKEACSEEENRLFLTMLKQGEELPTDIVRGEETNGTKLDEFYRVIPLYKTREELLEYCTLMQTKNLRTIKNCVVFFTVITVISLIITFLTLFLGGL